VFKEIKELSKKEWILILSLFILSELLILTSAGIGSFVPSSIGQRHNVVQNSFLNLFAQYDSESYLDIAKNGYNANYKEIGNYNHYPVYPLLVFLLGFFLSIPLAAFLVSNISFALAIFFLYLLLKKDFSISVSQKTIFLLLFFPTAYFFSMMYVESLILLFIVLFFYFARQKNWFLVGLFGFLASMTKAFGFSLVIPAVYLYLKEKDILEGWNIKWENIKNIDYHCLYVLAIPLGFILFLSYLFYLTGDPFIHFKLHSYYSASLTFPFVSIFHEIGLLQKSIVHGVFQGALYHILNVGLNFLFIFLVFLSFQKMKVEYSLYTASFGIILYMHESLESNLRFFLLFFPVFATLSLLSEKKWVRYLVNTCYIGFVFLLILLVIRHVNYDINYVSIAKQIF